MLSLNRWSFNRLRVLMRHATLEDRHVACLHYGLSAVGILVDRLPSGIPGGELQRFATLRLLSRVAVTQ